jgi:hypothetical protein
MYIYIYDVCGVYIYLLQEVVVAVGGRKEMQPRIFEGRW